MAQNHELALMLTHGAYGMLLSGSGCLPSGEFDLIDA